MALTVIGAKAADEVASHPVNRRDNNRAIVAQRPTRTNDMWQEVYEILPDLPLENQYTYLETGEVAENNTLIRRLIRYHLYVKGRPFQYRLDWKLTLADYLGANDLMNEAVYPSYDTLDVNPMEGDREAIRSLTRQQRDDLVHVLVSLFYPNYLALLERQASGNVAEVSPAENTETEPSSRNVPRLPQPGDAELLLP
ncbi:MAG: hypothetical protein J7641_02950 [Cyanobacteria bacterium SID2]|nr:hypothetical protein [Cyanobacteria bacterium SID2]MBP0006523.1 hypothetical protein [Cyanobacteria bacterium SBC]